MMTLRLSPAAGQWRRVLQHCGRGGGQQQWVAQGHVQDHRQAVDHDRRVAQRRRRPGQGDAWRSASGSHDCAAGSMWGSEAGRAVRRKGDRWTIASTIR